MVSGEISGVSEGLRGISESFMKLAGAFQEVSATFQSSGDSRGFQSVLVFMRLHGF